MYLYTVVEQIFRTFKGCEAKGPSYDCEADEHSHGCGANLMDIHAIVELTDTHAVVDGANARSHNLEAYGSSHGCADNDQHTNEKLFDHHMVMDLMVLHTVVELK